MLAPRPRTVRILVCISIATVFLLTFRASSSLDRHALGHTVATLGLEDLFPELIVGDDDLNNDARTNATLGFGAIAVVTQRDAKDRRDALYEATDITELEVVTPRLPKWKDRDFQRFKNGPGSTMSNDAIASWLGHLHVLKWFLKTKLETILIIEDDIDFDIHLRSKQVPYAAHAARTLLQPASPTSNLTYYWGHPSTWDMLYLGHCGDYFAHPEWHKIGLGHQSPSLLDSIPHERYEDRTMPNYANLHPFTSAFLQSMSMPTYHRLFHRSRYTTCSSAYALTRGAAWKILNIWGFAKESPDESLEKVHTYDEALLKACEAGFASSVTEPVHTGLKCYTVNPELVRTKPATRSKTDAAALLEHIFGMPPVQAAGLMQAEQREETSNIACGFWKRLFTFPRGKKGKKKLEWLKEHVGRGGLCLKPGRDSLDEM